MVGLTKTIIGAISKAGWLHSIEAVIFIRAIQFRVTSRVEREIGFGLQFSPWLM